MIIYFKVGNFRTIKDPIVINFQATSLTGHEENILEEGNVKLLRSVLLYGHNASGKTTLAEAFVVFTMLMSGSTERKVTDKMPVEPFRFNEATEKAPTFFECMFLLDGVKYRYGFEASQTKVYREWLMEAKVKKEYPVFLRIGEEFQIDAKRLPNSEGLQVRTRENVLFLSVCAQWNVKRAERIIQFFDKSVLLHGLMDESYKQSTIDMLRDDKFSHIIKDLIKTADLGIIDVQIYDLPVNDNDKKDIKTEVVMVHSKYDANGKLLDIRVPVLLSGYESEGTRKFFNIIGAIVYALHHDLFVLIDEFDARLHSILSKAILKLFNSKTIQSKSQILVVTHDTSLIDKELLRRDQIGFVEKDNFGAAKLTMLSTYKPRRGTPYDKKYLEGKYGGIPVIEEFEKIVSNAG